MHALRFPFRRTKTMGSHVAAAAACTANTGYCTPCDPHTVLIGGAWYPAWLARRRVARYAFAAAAWRRACSGSAGTQPGSHHEEGVHGHRDWWQSRGYAGPETLARGAIGAECWQHKHSAHAQSSQQSSEHALLARLRRQPYTPTVVATLSFPHRPHSGRSLC